MLTEQIHSSNIDSPSHQIEKEEKKSIVHVKTLNKAPHNQNHHQEHNVQWIFFHFIAEVIITSPAAKLFSNKNKRKKK